MPGSWFEFWAWMLAGRPSSSSTCFTFLENHSLSHPRAGFRFKARTSTTGRRVSLPLNTTENVLEIGLRLCPCAARAPARELVRTGRWIPGIPGCEEAPEDGRPRVLYKHTVGMSAGPLSQRHDGPGPGVWNRGANDQQPGCVWKTSKRETLTRLTRNTQQFI